MQNRRFGFLRFPSLFVIFAFLFCLVPSKPVYAAALINETFRNSSIAGWSILSNSLGVPVLTSGGIDLVGQGWLRLTDALSQRSTVVYDTPFSSADGLQAIFTYATYTSDPTYSGADGFSFYLIDGSVANPTQGPSGGSLGYSYNTNNGAQGVSGGYVGIGFDEYGNFSANFFGACNPNLLPASTYCIPDSTPNSITVRGSGDQGNTPGFYLLATTSATIQTGGRTNAHKVRITLTPPSPSVLLKVEMDSGAGYVTYINSLNLSTAYGQAALPATFKVGFSGSTGGEWNIHEIRDLVVTGGRPTTTTLTSSSNPISAGQPVTFTATVVGSIPTGNVTFMDGSTVLGNGILDVTGKTTLVTSGLGQGNHSISALFEGDPAHAGSASGVVSQVISAPAAGLLPGTGFRRGEVARLPLQPDSKKYSSLGDLWLEIPKLKKQASIIGVPVSNNGWDVTWLGGNAGWLQGTTFPTWAGNSVVTGHVWNADNTPGIFLDADKLTFGDQIIVHGWGQTYMYEVRKIYKNVKPADVAVALKHETYPWLTLVTCSDFSERTGSYMHRIVVKAIQVSIT